MVYITRFPQQHDIETKNGKENGHSYSYLEAIDTVNNQQNKESNNITM